MLRTPKVRPREVAAWFTLAFAASMFMPRAVLGQSSQTPGAAASTAPAAGPPPPAATAAGAATIEIVLPEGSAQRTEPRAAPPPPAAPAAAPATTAPATPQPTQPPDRDAAANADTKRKPKVDWFMHGFRLGYSFMSKMEGSADSDGDGKREGINYKEEFGLKSPHMFLLGYELTQRMMGHSWLNIIFVENIMLAGLEQSRVLPSGNLVLGFEFDQAFQVGVGANLAPVKDKTVHMVFAAGWTPRVGSFYTPVHAFFMPDVDGQHRTGITVGVNW